MIIVTGDYYPRQEGCPERRARSSTSESTASADETTTAGRRSLRLPLDPTPDRALARGSSSPTSPPGGVHTGFEAGGLRLGEGLGQRRPRSHTGCPSAPLGAGLVLPCLRRLVPGWGAAQPRDGPGGHRPRRAACWGRRRPLHRATRRTSHPDDHLPGPSRRWGAGRVEHNAEIVRVCGWGAGEDDGLGVGR